MMTQVVMTVMLDYSSEKCERDMNRILDAPKYDLQYHGNYKSLMAARYYGNAVHGTRDGEDFLLRKKRYRC